MKNASLNGVTSSSFIALKKALGQVYLRCFTIVTVRTKVLVAILINLLVQDIVFYSELCLLLVSKFEKLFLEQVAL